MTPKGRIEREPKKYRPIIYNSFTSVLTSTINSHNNKYTILAHEKNGCRKHARGSKELLVIDFVVTEQTRIRERFSSVEWIDYKEAFDSVPHSWMLTNLTGKNYL